MARKQINFTPSDATAAWIESLAERTCTPPSSVAGGLVELLRDSAARELRRTPLTLGEARALAQMTAGTMMDVGYGLYLVVGWHDTLDDWDGTPGGRAVYEADYGVDADQLTAKLAGLTPLGDFALRDALSRWWQADWGEFADATDQGFGAVGIRIADTAAE
ncbi:MAG: hypothetical protein LBR32_10585 [Propionibacteriaceae bacterium]|jgi:hypothetical protein|nr:hypothetical protein [Propionibacteriaceae bacterium]